MGGNRRTACCFANACWIEQDQHRVDPRHEGGRINKITTRDIVKLFEFEGDEWLFYKVAPVTVAFIRGTTADPMGNITMEKEPPTLNNLAMAMAAKNSNGDCAAHECGSRR